MLGHKEKTLSAPFFLSLRTPVPESLKEADVFLRDPPSNSVLSYWNAQLNRLGGIITDAPSLDSARHKLSPTEIKPAAGKIQLAALSFLASICDTGASNGYKNSCSDSR